jgi:cold shock CspA family protein
MEKGVTKRYTKDIRLIQMPEDVVEVQTKWFSAQEGYGFLTTENHTDCRIRARVLEAANIQSYELNKKNKFFVRLSSSSGITKVAEIWRATL